jgi:hypothetical protein
MENIEIINLWKQYDEKLEKSLSLNKRIIAELQQQKAKHALRGSFRVKMWTVILGLSYVAMLIYFLTFSFSFASVYLKVSVGLHALVCLIATISYSCQLVQIRQIDNAENILQMQQKLAKLQVATVNVVAILCLQLPVFSTFNITEKLIYEMPLQFWFIQVPIVLLFATAGIWLYRMIDIKNMDKKWFKLMFYGDDWSSMIKAGKFLREVKDFEKI